MKSHSDRLLFYSWITKMWYDHPNRSRSRGYGFVEVPAESVQAVIKALNGSEWGGRPMSVKEVELRKERIARPTR